MDFRSQLAVLKKSLHTFKPNDDWAKELDALLADIEGKLHDRRNRYIHDLWRDDAAGGIVQIERGKGEVKVDRRGGNARLVWKEPKPAIIEELQDFFERISTVYENLLRLQTRYMEWVIEDTKRLQQENKERKYSKLADVVGLCSGTVHAMGLAVADPRVVGILMFDGYSFAGRRWHWERALLRAMAAPTNPAVIGKTVRWFRRKVLKIATPASVDIFRVDEETPAHILTLFRTSMNDLTQRGVAVYLLYSGTQHVRDRNRDHLGVLVREPFAEKVKYEFARDIDHTFISMASQQAFMVRASVWALDIASRVTVPVSPGEATPLAAVGTRRMSTASRTVSGALF